MNNQRLPSDIANLIIIDKPAKKDLLEKVLTKLGLPGFCIIATEGVISTFIAPPSSIGIYPQFNFGKKYTASLDVLARIVDWGEKSKRVLIATETDEEGDVLAVDIANLLSFHDDVARVKLRSLEIEDVLDAFTHLEPVYAADASPGIVRMLVSNHVDQSLVSHGVQLAGEPVLDLVQLAILGLTTASESALGEATIVLPAADGLAPFVCVIPVHEENFREIERCISLGNEFIRRGGEIGVGMEIACETPLPWNYGEAILAISRKLDVAIIEVVQSLDRLYESGRLSYPKTRERSLSAAGTACLIKMADDFGTRIDPSRIASFSKVGRHSFESPRPYYERIDISAPLKILRLDDAALSAITRNLLLCGSPMARNMPDPASTPEWAKNFPLVRTYSTRMLPWSRRRPECTFRRIGKTEAALKIITKYNLGYTPFWPMHALAFASSHIWGEENRLGERGIFLESKVPGKLLDPETVLQIERLIDQYCGSNRSPVAPQQVAKKILEGLTLWSDDFDPIKSSLTRE